MSRGRGGKARPTVLWAFWIAIIAAVAIGGFLRGRTLGRATRQASLRLTVTGDARTLEEPALSPDGRRLAYVAHDCDSAGACRATLVVQDTSGAGRKTLVQEWARIWRVQWSASGAWIVFEGRANADSGDWGAYRVAPSGGDPSSLGCCGGRVMTRGDTILNASILSGDSIVRLRWQSIADSGWRDSTTMMKGIGGVLDIRPFPDDRRFLVVRSGPGGSTLSVMDRGGREGRRLDVNDPRVTIVGIAADGRSVVGSRVRMSSDESDLLRYPVDPAGVISPRADTVLAYLRGSLFLDARGRLLQATGDAALEVWALRRDSPRSMAFTSTKLMAAPVFISAYPNPAGDLIATWRSQEVRGRRLTQLGVMPSAGGAERSIGAPRDVLSWTWSRDGSALLVTDRHDGDSVAIERLDIADTRPITLARVAADDYGTFVANASGGALVIAPGGRRIRRVAVPGFRDSTFEIGSAEPEVQDAAPSPDGHDVVVVGPNATGDSVIITRMSVATGRRFRLAAVAANFAAYHASWLTDGTVLVPLRETDTAVGWYRIPATGGRAMRLGPAPRDFQIFYTSADGKLIVGRVVDSRADIYLLRDPGEPVAH